MKKIIIDTNALMAVTEFKIDIFSALEECCDFNYSLSVLKGTIEELNKIIMEQRSKYKLAAKLALSLLKAKKVKIIEDSGKVDDLLIDYSKKGYLVLTKDYALKKKLTRPYLTFGQKKKVELVR